MVCRSELIDDCHFSSGLSMGISLDSSVLFVVSLFLYEGIIIKRDVMAGISPREEQLIAAIGSSEKRVFTVSEAAQMLNVSNIIASKIIHHLTKKRKLQRIEKAKYLLIPPEAWKTGEYTEEGIIVASQLIEPYYLSYWTALSFHGWTEQPSRTIFVATPKIKKPVELQGITIRFVKLAPKRFFGFEVQWVGNQKVTVADSEKSIVDCLDQPRYCGEIVEVVKGLWNGRKELDFQKLLDYALRMKNGAVLKRLGFLMDVLEIHKPTIRNNLLKNITPNFALLDPGEKGQPGNPNREWRIYVNVAPDNLTEWRMH